jgi:Rrf2 family iron-sulfur cluster assembly transcriptional regulator
MLRRGGIYAIRALLELAQEPQRWRSGSDLAQTQGLPGPMLEQLLLKLRRAGLLESRRGRQGGYRLARPAKAIPLAAVLEAVAVPAEGEGDAAAALPPPDAGDAVTHALERRLQLALERELGRITLEDLLHDLRSTRAALSEEGGLLLG